MGQITATRNLVGTKVVRHAGQQDIQHTLHYTVHKLQTERLNPIQRSHPSKIMRMSKKIRKQFDLNDIATLECIHHQTVCNGAYTCIIHNEDTVLVSCHFWHGTPNQKNVLTL